MCKFGILLLTTCLVATASAGRLSRIVKRATGLPKYDPSLHTSKKPLQDSYVSPYSRFHHESSPQKSDEGVNRKYGNPIVNGLHNYDSSLYTSKSPYQNSYVSPYSQFQNDNSTWKNVNRPLSGGAFFSRYSGNEIKYPTPAPYHLPFTSTYDRDLDYTKYVYNPLGQRNFPMGMSAYEWGYYGRYPLKNSSQQALSNGPNNEFKPEQKPSDKETLHNVAYYPEYYQKLHPHGYVGNVPNNGYKPTQKPFYSDFDHEPYESHPQRAYGAGFYYSHIYNPPAGYVGNVSNNGFKPTQKPSYSDFDDKPYGSHPPRAYGAEFYYSHVYTPPPGYVGNVPNNGYKPGEKPNDGKSDYGDLNFLGQLHPIYGIDSGLYPNPGGYVGNAPNNGFKPANQDYKQALPKYEPSKFGTESSPAPWSRIEISSGPYAPRNVVYHYSDFSPDEAKRIGLRTTTATPYSS